MVNIRPYRPEDQRALQDICRRTANKHYAKNEKTLSAVTILYNDYYTECEPENVFVAADETDTPVGYVLCCTDDKKFVRAMRTIYKKRLFKTCPSMVSEIYATNILIRLIPKTYRTHLHIDILPEYQHLGIGTRLLDALISHLHDKNIPCLSVLSISASATAYPFYIKYGFTVQKRLLPTVHTLSVPTDRK